MSDRRHRPSNSPGALKLRVRVRGDTIVAVATPPGRSAVSVVRASGPDAERIGRLLVSAWPVRPRELRRCQVHDTAGHPIDDGLVVYFAAPQSYTGETIVELHLHGGTVVPVAVLAAFVAGGARLALPGEFTERAVLAGKVDLVQAEAIGELIDARTRAGHRAALHALSGAVSKEYTALRSAAIEVEALIAYDLDFPDEDHGPLARARVADASQELAKRLAALIATSPAATVARSGAVVVLAGPPNAGKSSLFNALVGEARAIVSEEAGTTRDAIEVFLDTEPWPIRLVDTAGLRSEVGAVERLGIEVSERFLRAADVILACAESSEASTETVSRVRELSSARVIAVLTKADLQNYDVVDEGVIAVSARLGSGLGGLQERISQVVGELTGHAGDDRSMVSSARQVASLRAAAAQVSLFREKWDAAELPTPVAATHLRAAITALDDLIGTVGSDDVLARVFASFCIGK